MPSLVADCPRCATVKITFDVEAYHDLNTAGAVDWFFQFEVFGVCRSCSRGTIFMIELKEYAGKNAVKQQEYWGRANVLNHIFRIIRFISVRDRAAHQPPEHVPAPIAAAFNEGATCLSVECFNAATAMFRLCLDLASKPLLPDAEGGVEPQPNNHQRRNLKPRLEWLLETGALPADLTALLDNLREDGNDGAHDGTLDKADAEDAMDFATILLQRMYTNPERLKIAEERRANRRSGGEGL